MSDKYGWTHQQERQRWVPVVEAGDAHCAEKRCLMRSRWITPGSKWHLAHDESGTIVIGVSHARCNTSEGATRGNRMRGRRARSSEPKLPQANRWRL